MGLQRCMMFMDVQLASASHINAKPSAKTAFMTIGRFWQ